MALLSKARINCKFLTQLQHSSFQNKVNFSSPNIFDKINNKQPFKTNSLILCAFSANHASTILAIPTTNSHHSRLLSGESSRKTSIEKLKRLSSQYGPIALGTHIVISLCSLGSIYFLLYSGFDVVNLVSKLGFDVSNAVAGSGTFAVAYVIHKLIVPIRVTITVTTVPLLVRYLRKIGLFKK